jgi:adenylylsulfate kinase
MGCVVLAAFISPYTEDRQSARATITQGNFFEIYCHCELTICEQRDVKGLYQKARTGEINAFTGISSPYEAPTVPDLQVETGTQTIESCVAAVLELLRQHGVITLS